jgi:hypothetical protein
MNQKRIDADSMTNTNSTKSATLNSHRITRFMRSNVSALVLQALLGIFTSIALRADQIVYDDDFRNGWQNWSWATVDSASTTSTHTGPKSISVTAEGWAALWFENPVPMDATGFSRLTFWINGGTVGGQSLYVQAFFGGAFGAAYPLPRLAQNTWQQINLTTAQLGLTNQPNFTGFLIVNAGPDPIPTFYVDDVSLQSNPPPQALTNLTIYTDSLQGGWENWSWAAINLANSNPFHSGTGSISATVGPWQALWLWHPPFDTTRPNLTNLSFWINGGSIGGQVLQVQATINSSPLASVQIGPIAAATWTRINIPMSNLVLTGQSPIINGIQVVNNTPSSQPPFFIDDISFQAATPVVTIDAGANRRRINPLIYGVNTAANSNQLAGLNPTIHRSGGNLMTTYNWQLNAANHDSDWYFESLSEGSNVSGALADNFVQMSKAALAEPMLTIPMIGWVAKLGPNRSPLWSYSIAKYGAQTGFDPEYTNNLSLKDAGTGWSAATGEIITNNDPNDAYIPADTNFQADWVRHLTNQWGVSTNGGVRYYIMDNEWSLWSGVHFDIHPIGPTMDEVLDKYYGYSAMVKQIDPNALIVGPEEWSWPGYLYSGSDQQWAGQHNDHNPAHFPDRAAHGGQDFAPWFLSQIKQRGDAIGKRLLDVFSLHIYPQGAESTDLGSDVSVETQFLRNRSTRSLWDPTYLDESWIGATYGPAIMLIPRMKSWVATNYPGTQIGITEYNWGAEEHMNGATTQADILGIFGREGLDIATRYGAPTVGTPVYNAFRMYRNYDGNNSTFGETSVSTTVENPDKLSAFSSTRFADGALTVIVINKDPSLPTPVMLNVTNFSIVGAGSVWQLATNTITQLPDISVTNGVLNTMLPAQSITLFILPSFGARLATNQTTGLFKFSPYGRAGLSYVLQTSLDLNNWTSISTNVLSPTSPGFNLPTTNHSRTFYRLQLLP